MWEHFMNPILMENFAQVIKGFHTSDSTIQAIDTLLQSVGIEIKLVNDSEGVASNRLSHLSFIVIRKENPAEDSAIIRTNKA